MFAGAPARQYTDIFVQETKNERRHYKSWVNRMFYETVLKKTSTYMAFVGCLAIGFDYGLDLAATNMLIITIMVVNLLMFNVISQKFHLVVMKMNKSLFIFSFLLHLESRLHNISNILSLRSKLINNVEYDC
jgi:hypothetical protein